MARGYAISSPRVRGEGLAPLAGCEPSESEGEGLVAHRALLGPSPSPLPFGLAPSANPRTEPSPRTRGEEGRGDGQGCFSQSGWWDSRPEWMIR